MDCRSDNYGASPAVASTTEQLKSYKTFQDPRDFED